MVTQIRRSSLSPRFRWGYRPPTVRRAVQDLAEAEADMEARYSAVKAALPKWEWQALLELDSAHGALYVARVQVEMAKLMARLPEHADVLFDVLIDP